MIMVRAAVRRVRAGGRGAGPVGAGAGPVGAGAGRARCRPDKPDRTGTHGPCEGGEA